MTRLALYLIGFFIVSHLLFGCASHVVDQPTGPAELLVQVRYLKENRSTYRVAHSWEELERIVVPGTAGVDYAIAAIELDASGANQTRAPWFAPGQGLDSAQCGMAAP